jgi:mannosyltransferase OCH1-like enzyme
MDSWKAVLPDYEIRFWDRAPATANCNLPILVHNYLKYWAIVTHGGIFVDNDIEMVRPFDLSHKGFLAFQRDDTWQDCINTAVIACEKGNPFFAACLKDIENVKGRQCPIWMGCGLPTDRLINSGLAGLNQEQDCAGIHVYAKDAFYPWGWKDKPDRTKVTGNTRCIHWWCGSWNK